MNIKKLLLLSSLLLFMSNIYAKFENTAEQRGFTVKGVLVDSIRNTYVEFATISMLRDGSANGAKYVLTNSKGEFEIKGLAAGNYILKAEYMGFETVEKSINVASGTRMLDIGKIGIIEKVNFLESAVVTALGNPITIKKDTIEYNATSFKSADSDMLEELLKKLPGIEISSDGKITANGKEITKIMIDGKTFFLNDPQLATKNLPAKIIEKVRVVDRQSEQARFTGIDDGNEETVIDLSIRPGMMNGWFGNLTGGLGSEDKFQTAGMVGKFTSTSQLTFIGNGNNTNNRAFTNLAGGMMSGMRGSMRGGSGGFSGGFSGGGSGGIRVGGTTLSFGGSGITESWMAGINANTELYDGKLKIGGNYFYGGTDNISESSRVRENFMPDSSFFNRDSSFSNTITDGHRVAMELEWKFSEKSSILFRPNVSIGTGSFEEKNYFLTEGAKGTKINDGFSRSTGDNSSQSLGGDLLFRQRLGVPGRTFSVNFTYSYSNNDLDGFNFSETNIYGNRPSVSYVNQMIDMNNNSYSLGARASYTEPLGNNYFMELAYRYNFSRNISDKESYNYNDVTGQYDILDADYTNYFKNTFISQQAEVNIRKNEEKYSYSFGFNVQPSTTESISDSTLKRSVVNFSPSAQLDYRFNDARSLRIRYRGNTNEPTISQLQPVRDNSNPLYIPLGNPDLLPEFNHRLWVDFRDMNRSTFRSTSLRLGANYTMDKIVNKTWYDQGGIQYTMPVNENGVYSIFSMFMYNTPIKKSKFFVMANTTLSLNGGINYFNALRNKTTSLSLSEMLRVTYRGDKLEASVGGRASYSNAWYSIETSNRPSTWNNSVNFYINWTLPAGFALISDVDHRFYIGYEDGFNEPSTVWNAEISKQLFKKSSTLSLKVFDILKDSRNTWRNATDNYIEDVRNNTLQQYVMLSFTIRFGSFGSRDGQSQGRPSPGHRMGGGRPF